VDYIGFVRIGINFERYVDGQSNRYDNVIDTTNYDKLNTKTLSAEEILFNEHQITPFLLTKKNDVYSGAK